MKKRNTVFDSKSEEELYSLIKSYWSGKYNIYPSLPFSNIINFSKGKELDNKEKEFLYKTSVDYTLCNKETNEPILSIDFDGIYHGFNKNGEYLVYNIFQNETEAKIRKLKFDLKLKVAEEADYAYFIVSYDEKNPIGEEINLTIVDGIIGYYLQTVNTLVKINNFVKENEEILKSLDPSIKDDYIYDNIIIPAEVEAEMEFNPISKKAWDYEVKVLDRKINYKAIHLEIPELPPLPDSSGYDEKYLEALEKRVKNWNNIIKFGCKCEIILDNGDVISETAWVRNIDNIHAMGLAEDISKLIAFRKLEKMGKL